MSGGLAFVGGFAQGLNNINAQNAEKRMRDQERFGALAMNSISEYKRDIARVRKEHQELNNLGKQLIASGVEPEKVDYALSLPYNEAIKFMSNPDALRNVEVKPRQPQAAPNQAGPAPAAAPGAPVAGPQVATAAQGTVMPQQPQPAPTAPAAAPAPTPMAPTGQPPQATAPQTFGMVPGTTDPLADSRNAIALLAKNAGWSPQMMQQFEQALQGGTDIGIYRFSNPETAGQLVFRDPKQIERVAKANENGLNLAYQTAARLDPTMPAGERIRVINSAFQDGYKAISGNTMDGAITPSPELFKNLLDPVYARQQLEQKQKEKEHADKVAAFTTEYIRQGMKPEDARIKADATARGMTQSEPRQGPDPNPGFNQIYGIVGSQFKGEIVPDSMTGQIRVNITDPGLRSEALLATSVAQELYRASLSRSADGRTGAMTPAQAAQGGIAITNASKTMLSNAVQATPGRDMRQAVEVLQRNLQAEMNKPNPDRNRVYALEGAITLAAVQEEQAKAPVSPPAVPTTPPAPTQQFGVEYPANKPVNIPLPPAGQQ